MRHTVVAVFLPLFIQFLIRSPCRAAWTGKSPPNRPHTLTSLHLASTAIPWFATEKQQQQQQQQSATASLTTITTTTKPVSTEQLKAQLLQLGAALDRGQAYNPTSGAYYKTTMEVARSKIQQLCGETTNTNTKKNLPKSLKDMDGEWELVLSTVPHGIFRSSPFFLAIQEAYEYGRGGSNNDNDNTNNNSNHNNTLTTPTESKANLFFKLHELQTCSWGISKVGRIAQHINASQGYLYSTFDTSLFSLTVIPIVGWFKLLPTFGGCVVTAAKCQPELVSDIIQGRTVSRLDMVVDYTTSRKVPGLNGLPLLGDYIWKIKVPVGAIWKILPWNKGREATCKVYITYLDYDFRIVQDIDGEYFVYTRPVVPRALEDMMDK